MDSNNLSGLFRSHCTDSGHTLPTLSDYYKLQPKPNRLPLVCKFCITSVDRLPAHLTRQCMKGSTPEQVAEVVKEARESVVNHLQHGRIFNYDKIWALFDDKSPTIIGFLEDAGCYVTGKPTQPHTVCHLMAEEQTEKENVKKDEAEELDESSKTYKCEMKTPSECLSILKVAENDFLYIMEQVAENKALSLSEQTLLLHYLEAVLILKYLQKPSVVKNLLVEEWLDRQHCETEHEEKLAVVTVKQKKTSDGQASRFPLNAKEENWFQEYFMKVRSRIVKDKEIPGECSSAKETFFVSSVGERVSNPSKDLARFIEKYKLPHVSSRMVQRLYLEASGNSMKDMERNIFAKVRCDEKSILRPVTAAHQSQCMDEATTIQIFLNEFPVTINGNPPRKKERIRLVGDKERHCYDKWRVKQQLLRTGEVLKHFTRRQPSEHQLSRYYQSMGWTKNLPLIGEITERWKSTKATRAFEGQHEVLGSLVEKQAWRGLHITSDETKGRTVITTRSFLKGEILCDYHVVVIPAEKGKQMMKSHEGRGEGILVFFLRFKRKVMVHRWNFMSMSSIN